MASEHYQTDLLAKYMAIGMHGFLCDPCSLDDMVDVLEVASKMKAHNSDARLKAVSGIMLHELMNDAASKANAENIKRCRERYREVTGESISNAVVTMLRHLPPSERGSGYERVRKRVQELFHSKAVEGV